MGALEKDTKFGPFSIHDAADAFLIKSQMVGSFPVTKNRQRQTQDPESE